MTTENLCRCGRPTRDEAYVCEDCSQRLAIALGDVAWLETELETSITRSKGVDYRTKGGTASSERPSPVVWSASDARTNLRGLLVAWCRFSAEENVRHQSPHDGLPADNLTAMSRWLLWRVDGLALLDIGAAAVDEITDAVAKCVRLIDTPVPKQYLGDCAACGVGRLYARQGGTWATCNTCAASQSAEGIRAKMIAKLEDRLCTAGEIADLSTYLGLTANRDQVRKRVETWGRKGNIERHSAISDQAVYRFGDVYAKLVEAENGGAQGSPVRVA